MRKKWFTWLRWTPFSLGGALILVIALSFFHSFGIDYAPLHNRIWECGLDRGTIVITALGRYENEGWTIWHNAPGILQQQVKANQEDKESTGTRPPIPGVLYVVYGQYLQLSFPSWPLVPLIFALSYLAQAFVKRTQLHRRLGKVAAMTLRYGIPPMLALLSATTIFSFYRSLWLDRPTDVLNIMTLDKGAITYYRDPYACFFDPGYKFGTDTPGSSLNRFNNMEDPINRTTGDYYFRCTAYCCIYHGLSGVYVALPLWLVLTLADSALFLSYFRPLRRIRRHRRTAADLCPQCSYDLRAHNPGDKCPECGTLIPTA